MAILGKLVAVVTADTSKFVKSMDLVEHKLEGTDKMAKGLATTLAGSLAAAGAVAIATFQKLATETVATGAKFEQTITTLGALKNATVQTQQALENQARTLGEQTLFTATQAAQAMQSLARAGLATNEIIGASGPALYFAGANATSMSSATSLLAATMAQFNLNASEATRITDVFTIAMQNSLLDMESLTTSMRYAGSVANSLGMSLEETTASIALFRDLGLDASTAGTQFRQAMLALAGPTRKAQSVIDKYNLSLKTSTGEMKTFEEIMTEIGKAQMSIEDVVALVSKRAAGSVATISRSFAEQNSKYQTLLNNFEQGAGQTEKTYNKMIDTVSGQFGILRSKMEESMLTAFDSIRRELKDLIKDLVSEDGVANQLIAAFKGVEFYLKNTFVEEVRLTMEALGLSSQGFASSIANLTIQGVRLTGKFLRLLTVLKDILEVIGYTVIAITAFKTSLFAITTVIAALNTPLWTLGGFILAIATGGFSAAKAMMALKAAMAALGAASVASLPHLAALGLAIAAVTAAYAYFNTEANQVTRDQNAIIEMTKKQIEVTKKYEGNIRRVVDITKTLSDAELKAATVLLLKKGELSARIKTQIDALVNMTNSARAAAVASGQLFYAQINGTNTLISHSLAVSLVNTGLADFASIATQAQTNFNNLQAASDIAGDKFRKAYQTMRLLNNALTENGGQTEDLSTSIARLNAVGVTQNGVFKGTNIAVKMNEETLTRLSGIVGVLQTEYQNAKAATEGFAAGQKQATEAFDQFQKVQAAQKELEENERKVRQATAAYQEWQRSVERLNEQIDKLLEKLYQTTDELQTEEAFKFSQALDADIKKMSVKFEELFDLYKNNSAKQIEVRKKQAQAINAITFNSFLKQKEDLDDYTRSIIEKQEKSGMSQVELAQYNNEQILDEEKLKHQQMLNLLDEALSSNEEIYQKVMEAEKRNAVRTIKNQEQLKEALDDIEQRYALKIIHLNTGIENHKEELAEESRKRRKAIKELELKELLELEEAALEEISQLEIENGTKTQSTLFKEQQDAAKKEFENRFRGLDNYEDLYSDFIRALQVQNKNYADSLIETFVTPYTEFADEILAVQRQLALATSSDRQKQLNGVLDYYNKVGQAQKDLQNIQKELESTDIDVTTRQKLLDKMGIMFMEYDKLIADGYLNVDEGRIGTTIGSMLAAYEKKYTEQTRGLLGAFGLKAATETANIRQALTRQELIQDGGLDPNMAAGVITTEFTQGIDFTGYREALREAETEATGLTNQFLLALKGVGKYYDTKQGAIAEDIANMMEMDTQIQQIQAKIAEKQEEITVLGYQEETEATTRKIKKLRAEIEELREETQKSLSDVQIIKIGEQAEKAGEAIFLQTSRYAKFVRKISSMFRDASDFIDKAIITPAEAFKDEKGLESTTANYFENYARGLVKGTNKNYDQFKKDQVGKLAFLKRAGISTVGAFYKGVDKIAKLPFGPIMKGAQLVIKVFSFLAKQFRAFVERTANQFKMVFQRLMRFMTFLTGGFSLNIFGQITESVNEYISKVDEITDKQKQLQEQLLKGEITQGEFREGMAFLGAEKNRSTELQIVEKFERAIAFADKLPSIAASVVQAFIRNLPRLFKAVNKAAIGVIDVFKQNGAELLSILIEGVSSLIVAILSALSDPAFQNQFKNIITSSLVPAIESALQAIDRFLKDGKFLSSLAAIMSQAAAIFLKLKLEVIKQLSDYLRDNPKVLEQLVSTLAQVFVQALFVGFKLAMRMIFREIPRAIAFGIQGIFQREREKRNRPENAMSAQEMSIFGDTPGPIKVGAQGMFAGFAPNDTVIAAQSSSNLLAQALQAYTSEMGAIFQTPPMGGGSSQPIDIAIMAEGRLLDAVQVTAMNNGNAPQMNKRFRRASGVNVGFNRGRYNKF